jgi:hypothetical protein
MGHEVLVSMNLLMQSRMRGLIPNTTPPADANPDPMVPAKLPAGISPIFILHDDLFD